ncbi:MAG: bifunctional diaminohydroxyphosphoribosylaminopyrimidine deaminase/5-amino-6-(5-phosphoribosylamino)uracil reductase RibD [Saprospiraceae bacterium]|nr:bifunctional diaminohydroxyphosphoribosylaminopyrimidine deaminase/5-amino-6-(5-phosphoribosylamino)uracil reductase RibD [Saprospiraceae bacterium]
MRRCFDLARFSANKVKTNPPVGALIVRGQEILSEGFHERFGGPHAEVNAIKSLSDEAIRQSDIYVSLEPCSHYGKTPPCAQLLVEKKIRACHISQIDPNPVVSGKGIDMLTNAGIEVWTGISPDEGAQLLRPFDIQQKCKRSYVILKWAQSRDGFMGMIGKRTKISSPLSDRLVHKWRSEVGAIMVGSNTVVVDDPQLGNRLYWGSSPTRVVLDRTHKISDSARILNEPEIPTLYYTSQRRQSENSAFSTVIIPQGEGLAFILKDLYQKEFGTVLVEGGTKLISHFIEAKLWDEIRIIENPAILNEGVKAPSLPMGKRRSWQLGEDRIHQIYPQ